MTSRNVNINIGASTRRYKKAVRSAEKATTKFGGSIGKLGKIAVASGAAAGVAIAAIGAIAIKVGIDSVQSFAKFEQSMSRIEGLVGVSHEKVAAFSEQVKELAVATAIGPQKLAEGLFFITSAGLEGAEAMEALEVSAKASAAGLGEVTIIADVVTSAVNAFGDSMGGAAVATDVLVATVREGKADAASLATAMGRVIPIASQMGISFDQVGASIAAMTRVGLDAAEASTALRSIMVSLLKPTTQADEALASMGLSAQGLRDQIRSEGLFKTLQTLTDAFDGNAEATTAVFGNIRALSGVMSLMGSNAEATEEIFRELAESTGALDTAFGVTAETGAFAFEQARARIDVALLDVGERLLPIIADAVDDIVPHVEDLVAAFGEIAVVLAEIGTTALPPIATFFENLPHHARQVQRGTLIFEKFLDILMTPTAILGLTTSAFGKTQQAQLDFLDVQSRVNKELQHGVPTYDVVLTALKKMSSRYLITADGVDQLGVAFDLEGPALFRAIDTYSTTEDKLNALQEQVGLTDQEMLQLVDTYLVSAIAAGDNQLAIFALEEASAALTERVIEARTPMEELKLSHIAFRDSLDATPAAIAEAAAAFAGYVLPIQAVRAALDEVRVAGENVASQMLEMTNPTFKAIQTTKRLKAAEDKLAEARKAAGKVISHDEAVTIAQAQVDVAQAKLLAQQALTELGATDFDGIEAAVFAFMAALELTREEALEILNLVEIIDSNGDITILVEFQTRVTGPMAGAIGRAGLSDFEMNLGKIGKLHGGPVTANQAVMVGEGGVELFVPDSAGRIIPNGDLATMSTSTSSEKTINLYIEGTETPGQDAESLLLLAGLVA